MHTVFISGADALIYKLYQPESVYFLARPPSSQIFLRCIDMGKYAVVIGDATSHGGKVSSASSGFEIQGKNAALLHDFVSCPDHGTNRIIECDRSAYEEGGRGIVIHGCKTQCGATVIASNQDMEVG